MSDPTVDRWLRSSTFGATNTDETVDRWLQSAGVAEPAPGIQLQEEPDETAPDDRGTLDVMGAEFKRQMYGAASSAATGARFVGEELRKVIPRPVIEAGASLLHGAPVVGAVAGAYARPEQMREIAENLSKKAEAIPEAPSLRERPVAGALARAAGLPGSMTTLPVLPLVHLGEQVEEQEGKGIDPNLLTTAPTAAINTGLDYLGFKKIFQLFGVKTDTADEIRKETIKYLSKMDVIKKAAKRYGGAVLTETATEATQEFNTLMTAKIIGNEKLELTPEDKHRLYTTVIDTAVGTAVFGFPAGAYHASQARHAGGAEGDIFKNDTPTDSPKSDEGGAPPTGPLPGEAPPLSPIPPGPTVPLEGSPNGEGQEGQEGEGQGPLPDVTPPATPPVTTPTEPAPAPPAGPVASPPVPPVETVPEGKPPTAALPVVRDIITVADTEDPTTRGLQVLRYKYAGAEEGQADLRVETDSAGVRTLGIVTATHPENIADLLREAVKDGEFQYNPSTKILAAIDVLKKEGGVNFEVRDGLHYLKPEPVDTLPDTQVPVRPGQIATDELVRSIDETIQRLENDTVPVEDELEPDDDIFDFGTGSYPRYDKQEPQYNDPLPTTITSDFADDSGVVLASGGRVLAANFEPGKVHTIGMNTLDTTISQEVRGLIQQFPKILESIIGKFDPGAKVVFGSHDAFKNSPWPHASTSDNASQGNLKGRSDVVSIAVDFGWLQEAARQAAKASSGPAYVRAYRQILFEITAHEYGHGLMERVFRRASPKIKAAIFKEYRAWVMSMHGVTVAEFIKRSPPSMIRHIFHTKAKPEDMQKDATAFYRAELGYRMEFNEFFADSVSRYINTRKEFFSGETTGFWKGLAEQIKELYAKFFRAIGPTPRVEAYLDALVRYNTLKRTAPKIALETTLFAQKLGLDRPKVSPVTAEEISGAGNKQFQAQTTKSLPAIRRGEISPTGAYFSTPGASTYYDTQAVETGEAEAYDLSNLHIADTTDKATTIKLLREVLKDASLSEHDRGRVKDALKEAVNGEPFIDYQLFDSLPIAAAAKRLGYDAVKVWENDDVGSPSSVFVMSIDKLTKTAPPRINTAVPQVSASYQPNTVASFDAQKVGASPVAMQNIDELANVTLSWPRILDMLTPLQISERYGRISQWIREYMSRIEKFANTKNKIMSRASELTDRLRTLSPERLARLSAYTYEVSLRSDEVGRRLTQQELIDIAKDAGIKLHEGDFKLWEEVDASFQQVLNDYEFGLVYEAGRLYTTNPTAFRDSWLAAKTDAERAALIQLLAKDVKTSTALLARMKDIKENIDALRNKNYFPRSRFGQFAAKMVATRDGVTYDGKEFKKGQTMDFRQYSSKDDRTADLKYMQRDMPDGARISVGLIDDTTYGFMGIPQFIIDQIRDNPDMNLTDAQKNRLKDIALSLAPGRSFLRHLRQRKGIAGYSLDMIATYSDYMLKSANHIAKIQHAGDIGDALKGFEGETKALELPNTDARDALNAYFKQHFDYIMKPDNDWAKFRAIGFLWYLGANVKSAWVNLTQVPVITFPILAGKFGEASAMAEIARAYKDVRFSLQRVTGFEPAVEEALRRALADGIIDESFANSLAGTDENLLLQRLAPHGKMEHYLNQATYFGGWLFRNAEKYNRRVTLVAAMRLALKKGMSVDAAYQVAREAVQKSQFEYAKWNRPTFMRGKKSVAFLFWQWMQHATYLAFNGPGTKEGRKQAALFWMTMMVAGGLQGLPFAELLMDLLDIFGTKGKEIFGIENPRVDTRHSLRKLLHELEVPTTLAEVATHGVAKHYGLGPLHLLANFGVPIPHVDVSGSISMGYPVPFLRETTAALRESRDQKGKVDEAVMAAMGPVAAIPYTALQTMLSNDPDTWKKYERMLPTFVKNASKGIRQMTRGEETGRGRAQMLDMSDTEGRAESAAQMLGFAPTALSKKYEEISSKQQAREYWLTRRSMLLDSLADAYATGDKDYIARANEELKAYNMSLRGNKELLPLSLSGSEIRESLARRRKSRIRREADVPAERMFRPLFHEMGKVYQEAEETK